LGVWGLGIGDWGLGPIPNPQSPIPNPQSPINFLFNILIFKWLNNINKSLLNNEKIKYLEFLKAHKRQKMFILKNK